MKISISKLSHEGRGIGRAEDGKLIFVPKAIPGDIIEVKIQKEKSNFSEGVIQKIIQPSSDRVKAFCQYFDKCGGCDLQMVSYQKQLEFKEEIFKDILTRIGNFTDLSVVRPTIGMSGACPKYYRNKIRFAFMKEHNQIGFSRHNRSNPQAEIPVDFCYLQSERSNKLLKILKEWATKNELTIFNPKTLEGWLKYVLIREGKFTNDLMLDIVTSGEEKTMAETQDLASLLVKQLKVKNIISDNHLFSLYQMETSGTSNEKVRLNHLFGSKYITDKIGDFTFKISHDSFFQTNSEMARIIYNQVLEFLNPQKTDIVWDLYCGTGTIGIYIARLISQVIGIESCQPAIDDAKENAVLNQIQNIDFILGQVETQNFASLRKLGDPNSIIVDPPRAGLYQKTRDLLKRSKAKKIIYVSCSPQTLARDLKDLKECFKIQQIQPIDCFPHTHHLESVILIERL